jgi:hypothetical protein
MQLAHDKNQPEPSSPRIEVFLSYSRDGDSHRGWVGNLADLLEAEPDLHVFLDEYDLYGGKDLAHFMERCRACERVVVVVTSKFVERANQRKGGVGYESSLAAAELLSDQLTDKFIPVLREGSEILAFVGSKTFIDFRVDAGFETAFVKLLRAIRRQPSRERPPKRTAEAGPASTKGSDTEIAFPPVNDATMPQTIERSTQLPHLGGRSEKRPLVQVSFSWREGEPKEKPFIVANSGDDEARKIQIHPIILGSRSFSFDSIGQLLPKGPNVEREPQPHGNVGPLFRTLIDIIEMAVRDRTAELKKDISDEGEWTEKLDQHVRAEQKALDDFKNVPVTVTYENRSGEVTTLNYLLATTMFAALTRAELHFISEDSPTAAVTLPAHELQELLRTVAQLQPRKLTPDQLEALVCSLRSISPEATAVFGAPSDSESMQLAAQIGSAFQSAGWSVNVRSAVHADTIEGVQIVYMSGEHYEPPPLPMPEVVTPLVAAFGNAGLTATATPLAERPQEIRFFVSVGHKPRT